MSDFLVFFVGVFTFLRLCGGLVFTVNEVRNIEKRDTAKRELGRKSGPSH